MKSNRSTKKSRWTREIAEPHIKAWRDSGLSQERYGRSIGVPDALRSCHTGLIGGYAIEGHVPAADIKRLLAERPEAKGLTVPGMPMGSPGMEGSYVDPYSVLLFDADGRTRVFQSYGA